MKRHFVSSDMITFLPPDRVCVSLNKYQRRGQVIVLQVTNRSQVFGLICQVLNFAFQVLTES